MLKDEKAVRIIPIATTQFSQAYKCTGRYPGEDWQIDFTRMPKAKGHQKLLVWVDTFTRWIEP